jgi:Domain of unknown function (DU1801)
VSVEGANFKEHILNLKVSSEFKTVIAAYPLRVQARLLELRQLVLETATKTNGVGKIEEALRWNQPSFLTPETGSGSTIRIDGLRNDPEKCAMYFHCQSGLIDTFKELYGKSLTYEGNRALVFDVKDELPTEILSHCISLALTHHLRKKSANKGAKKNDKTIPHHYRH